MSQFLITGANGFVGSHLCDYLTRQNRSFVVAVRKKTNPNQVEVGNLDSGTLWTEAVSGCDAVIHLAARVHVMKDATVDPMRAYREVNVDGTMNLARQAAQCGVRRFIYVSSVKVNGEETMGKPYSPEDEPAPVDFYGQSKLEAEVSLRELAARTGMEIAVVRPPLVYGPGVRANFLKLMTLVRRGIPLPFGSLSNRRSLVAVDNLVDLLVRCVDHLNAPGKTFMVSDGVDLSTTELIEAIAQAMGTKPRLISCPPAMLTAAARLLGKEDVSRRLLGSLQVDITPTEYALGWKPVVDTQTALRHTVAYFLAKNPS